MKNLFYSRSYIFLLLSVVFEAPSFLYAHSADELFAHQNQGIAYVCFDKNLSDIALMIVVISALDPDKSSPVFELRQYLDNGHEAALRDEVLSVLDYADWFVDHYDDKDIQRLLAPQLEKVIEQVLRGELDVSEQDVMRSSDLRLTINSKARFRQDVRMDKKLYVHGKAHFDDDVEFKDDVKMKENLIIKGSLTVENGISVVDNVLGNVTIANLSVTDTLTSNSNSVLDQTVSGTLSANQVIAACDVMVGCNINMTASSNAAHGNIYKGNQSFIHNFGIGNTFVGIEAGNFTTTGVSNTAIGAGSLTKNTEGAGNTAVGNASLNANTQGNRNVALGSLALTKNTSGNDNTAVGYSALTENTVGTDNVAVGSLALSTNTVGGQNTAVGVNALKISQAGSNNVAVGYQALSQDTLGGQNTAVGALALALLKEQDNSNVAVGSGAGALITKGANNTFIGQGTAANLIEGDFNIYIGQGVGGTGNESSVIRIGNAQKKAFIAGIYQQSVAGTTHPVVIDSNGQLGTIASSKRFKHNIENIKNDSTRLYDLNPVKFVYTQDTAKTQQYGLIAEEVQEIFPELVIHEKDGKPFSVRYELLPVLLLNEMQKQQRVIEDLSSGVESFSTACNGLKKLVENLIAHN